MMEWLLNPDLWIAFLMLTALEIVLGIDNIIMVAILVGRTPEHMRSRTRFFGMALAMVTRILLLLSITWIMRLNTSLFAVADHGVTGRDLILFFGGLFLLWKSSSEIYSDMEGADEESAQEGGHPSKRVGFIGTIIQIAIIDIVFSLDSVITAVGMVSNVPVMVAAIVVAVLLMMVAVGTISRFIEAHPSLKMLALAFLIVVGVVLIADALGEHIAKGYIYFAMAFSLLVEMLNIRRRTRITRACAEQQTIQR
jgi:predicted tellurium resistance membrane protein TerC